MLGSNRKKRFYYKKVCRTMREGLYCRKIAEEINERILFDFESLVRFRWLLETTSRAFVSH